MEFRLRLRAFKMEDAKVINKLRQDEHSESTIGGNKRPVAYERDVKWVQDLILGDNPNVIYFAITFKDNDDMIGYCSISEIDYRNGVCFWSGTKIDPSVSSKGLGTESSLLLLRYIFEEMRMERCKGECLEGHDASLRMLDKLGFVREGMQRNKVFKNGKQMGIWLLSMIREEYDAMKIKFDM